jgi:hypothetical protein
MSLSILIWVIGVSIGYPLGDTVGRVYSPDGYWAPSEQKTYLVNIVASLIFGLAMGLGQGFLFQKYKLVEGWRWFAGTFGGFLIVAVIANLFHLQYLQMINAVIIIGGFDLPPAWLQLFSPWDRFLVGPYVPAEFRYLIWLAIVVGLFQLAFQKPKGAISASWIVWNFVGLFLGFLTMNILAIVGLKDIFPLSIGGGFIYGLTTAWPILFRRSSSDLVS